MFLLTFLFGYLNPTSLNTQFTITSTKSSLTISGLSYLQFCEFLEPLQPSCPPTRMLASGGQELLSTVFTDLSLSHKTGPGHDWCSTQFSSVQSLSCVWLFATPWTAACQTFLSITNSQSLPKLMSIESVMPSNCLILCRPLLLQPSIFPSIRGFSNESHHVAKVLEFQLQHQSF